MGLMRNGGTDTEINTKSELVPTSFDIFLVKEILQKFIEVVPQMD